MQYINKGETSSVYYRLNKVASYVTPSYIFDLENQVTRVNTVFYSEDLSSVPLSYNKFDFNLNLNEGEYNVAIYETDIIGLTQITASASLIYQDELTIQASQSASQSITYYNSYTASNSDDVVYFQ